MSGKGGSFWDLTRTGAFLSPGAAAGVASGHERGERVGSPAVTVAQGWWVGRVWIWLFRERKVLEGEGTRGWGR